MDQLLRLFGFSCTNVFVPGGATGVALKLKFPYNDVYADNDGCLRDERSKLSVREHCGIKWSHSFSGIFLSQRHNPVMRCFFVSVYCALLFVALMNMWRDKLIFDVFCFKCLLEVITAFVIENVKIGCYSLCFLIYRKLITMYL